MKGKRVRIKPRLSNIDPDRWHLWPQRNEQSCYWKKRIGITRYRSVPLAWVSLYDARFKRITYE